jgi:mannose-6-phosphate isomerase-like protein (cupin superfamily)
VAKRRRRARGTLEAGVEPVAPVDLLAILRASAARGPLWTRQSADLNVNLVALDAGQALAASVNAEVDVLLVGMAGVGVVTMDDEPLALAAGQALVIPKGARRAIASAGERFAYLTCHRRRDGLWPTNAPRPDVEAGSGGAD